MKIQALSNRHDTYPTTKVIQGDTAGTTDQERVVEARRNYYYNTVLKPNGIPNVPNVQKPFSPSETVQRAMAFKKRNQGLKYYIGLIQHKIIT